MSVEQPHGNESLGDKVHKLDAKRWKIRESIEVLESRERSFSAKNVELTEAEKYDERMKLEEEIKELSYELDALKSEWNRTQEELVEALQQMSEYEQIAFNRHITEQFIKIIDEVKTPDLTAVRDKIEKGLTHKDLVELCEGSVGFSLSNKFEGSSLEDEIALRKGGRQEFQY